MFTHSNISTVVLLGFPVFCQYKHVIFFLLLLVYSATILGNNLIVVLVIYSESLHTPMYIFLTQLTISDMILSTSITPNALYVVLNDGGTIHLPWCLFQFYLSFASVSFDCYLLTVMAYDRYLAICKPLHYNSIMTSKLYVGLITLCWVLGFLTPILLTEKMRQANFCGLNVIDHFYCDFYPIIQLMCSDTSQIQTEATLFSVPVVLCPFVIIVISYAYIVVTIIRMSSISGRWKVISTCSCHLSVVCLYYGTLSALYAFPKKKGGVTRKVISMFYNVMTPLLNAVIYSLRNKDIKIAYIKLIGFLYQEQRTLILH